MPAQLNMGVPQLVKLIMQLSYSEKHFLIQELQADLEFQKVFASILEFKEDVSLTAWEEEQIEIGLKDLENGKRIPHSEVMKEINEMFK